MEMMVKLTGAKRGIEVGILTGYSALCLASGLPEDGVLIACDMEERYVNIGRPYWEEAGVTHKIDVRIGPVLDTLDRLSTQPGSLDSFDFAHIDDDKTNYRNYVEVILPMLKPNGFIIIDNTLWGNRVADPIACRLDTNT